MFSGILFLLLFSVAALRARELTEVLEVYVLPLSPTIFILVICILAVAYVCALGLESLARFSRLIIAAMLFAFFLILALGWQNYELHRLFPIWGYGIGQTVAQGIARSSVYGEIIILAVFAGSLQGVEHIKKAGYIALSLAAFFISVSLLVTSLTFPYFTEVEVSSPIYELATLVDFGRYLQRVEAVFVFGWVIGSFISVAAVFYTFTSIYCQMFRIQDSKPIILPAGLLLLTLAMLPRDFTGLVFGGVHWLRQYGSIFFFMPPIVALLVAKLRGKGAKSHG
ncbi:MAG: GerAB/ArcD/ProY family transporter [Pelotomaculum sp.]